MAMNRMCNGLIRTNGPSDDRRALRETLRENARKLADAKDLARQACMAVTDHDLGLAQELLARIRAL